MVKVENGIKVEDDIKVENVIKEENNINNDNKDEIINIDSDDDDDDVIFVGTLNEQMEKLEVKDVAVTKP